MFFKLKPRYLPHSYERAHAPLTPETLDVRQEGGERCKCLDNQPCSSSVWMAKPCCPCKTRDR